MKQKRKRGIMGGFLSDLLLLSGLAAISAGAWLIAHSSGLIVGGICAVGVSVLIGLRGGGGNAS